jgi:hypothetical protein
MRTGVTSSRTSAQPLVPYGTQMFRKRARLQTHLPGSVRLNPFVRKRRPAPVAPRTAGARSPIVRIWCTIT